MKRHQMIALTILSGLLLAAASPHNEKDVADSVHAANRAIDRHHDEVQRWRKAGWGVERVQPAVGKGYHVFIQVAVDRNSPEIAANFPPSLDKFPVKVVQEPVPPTAILLPGVWR
jgi:hypothetical protein